MSLSAAASPTNKPLPLWALYLTVLAEGYIVLSMELIALRRAVPYAGSTADVAAIVICAVLLPLAAGYAAGGKMALHGVSVRWLLVRNLTFAAAVFTLGFSYLVMERFYTLLEQGALFDHALIRLSLHSLIFLVVPVYLLGQTVPLVARYFRQRQVSRAASRILFFSTVGSCLGAVGSTLGLMPWIGVGMTLFISVALCFLIGCVLVRRRFWLRITPLLIIAACCYQLNRPDMLRPWHVVNDNRYNTVRVLEPRVPKNSLLLELNRTNASLFPARANEQFPHVIFINRYFIHPLMKREAPADILILGAGGLTIGLHDMKSRYRFVDIDGSLKATTEKYLLKHPLSANKEFIEQDARSFVDSDSRVYDLIIIDTYSSLYALPEELVTHEWFTQVKGLLKPDGILVINVVTAPFFSSRYSIALDNTLHSTFSPLSRHLIEPGNPWEETAKTRNNVLYFYRQRPAINTVYTDDRHTLPFDRAH